MTCSPFYPYCRAKAQLDLANLKRSKLVHIAVFAVVAITLTIIGEHGLAKLSLAGVGIRALHLVGEVVADRVLGLNIFGEGK